MPDKLTAHADSILAELAMEAWLLGFHWWLAGVGLQLWRGTQT